MKSSCVVGNVRSISKLMDKYIAKRIKEKNIPILMNHIPLFYILTDTEEVLTFNEIMKRWGISKSSLSDIICKYSTLGYIEKCSCAEDKRTIYIKSTPKILEIRNELDAIENELLDSMFEDNEIEIFEDVTRKLLARGIDL